MKTATWVAMGVAALVASGFSAQDQSAKPYNLVDIGTLGGRETKISAINGRKIAVGGSATASGGWRPMLWSDGNTFEIPIPNTPGAFAEATSINESGVVVANLRVDARHEVAYLIVGERTSELGSLGGTETHATQINDRGQVVGWSTTRDGIRRAFVWTGGSMKDLGTLSTLPKDGISTGDAGGTSSTGSATTSDSKSVDIREGNVRIQGSAGGTASGSGTGAAGGQIAGRASGSGQAAADPRFRQSMAYGLNERGEVVGSAQNPAGQWRAVVWKSGGIVDIGPSANVQSGSSGSESSNSTSSKTSDSKVTVERGNGSIRVTGQASGSGRASGSAGASRSAGLFTSQPLGSAAVSINENSEIVGWYEVQSSKGRVNRAFLHSKGKFIDLSGEQVSSSQAMCINDKGAIVGTATSRNGMPFAFLFVGGAMIDLNGRIVEAASVGRGMFEAVCITNEGAIAVNLFGTNGTRRGAMLVKF